MGWRFRKSFKILPGVRVNIGKKGISGVTLGKRGFTTSVGKDGVHQNMGVSGTGLSFRQKIGGVPSDLPVIAGVSLGLLALVAAFVLILMYLF